MVGACRYRGSSGAPDGQCTFTSLLEHLISPGHSVSFNRQGLRAMYFSIFFLSLRRTRPQSWPNTHASPATPHCLRFGVLVISSHIALSPVAKRSWTRRQPFAKE